ncbi:formate dehydrogenase accessory sulfurtransferase FdhD [Salinibacillus xinjiangensis]|uniref:Sulfur carrier protein FdhD n=1 Tax=Salinibacillus xinjiangensis TaxID=1229268 RepID=A0A6G1X2X3_9BACI|nr:formate dehydrogenase accessory sulfurtransferase FdhD [Salinibacillus xinjiangensis]MRG85246.1 formate dehydrogenase accessory sulfurtransferase FdhD [Salinibacillus xinjiangensis]
MNTEKINVVKYDGDDFDHIQDTAAIENPLTIQLDGEEFATMVCTPGYLEELVIGFLGSEGIIRSVKQIESLQIDADTGFAYVKLVNKGIETKDYVSKRFIGSCCGKSRQFYFYNDAKTAKTVMSKLQMSVYQCIDLMNEMQMHSTEYRLTGGFHNAALATKDELLLCRNDIGRHNALDKIFGYCLQNRISLSDKVIVFSGRISSEIVLKVAKIGAPILLSKSAPTTLAIQLAKDLGITCVGFIRNNRLNVYTHPERIQQVH